MTETAFFDTNILVYLHDVAAPEKQRIAREIFQRHFAERKGALSTQVLQEFFVSVTRKVARLAVPVAARLVGDYAQLNTITIEPRHILNAIDIHARFRVSFWDGLILAAAKSANASILFSEDFSHGQTYDGVMAQDPFRQLLNQPRLPV